MEFQIHHSLSELIKALGVQDKIAEGASLNNYAEYLRQNQTPYVTTRPTSQSALKKLAESTSDPSTVFHKYEDLKARNFRELDSLVHLLSEISADEQVKGTLKKHWQETQKLGRSACNGVTDEEPSKVRNILKKHPESHNPEDDDVQNDVTEEELQKLKTEMRDQIAANLIESKGKQRSFLHSNSEFPRLIKDRPNLTWDFNCQPRHDNIKVGPIAVLPQSTQEALLIKDILFCLSGIDGDYITARQLKQSSSTRLFNIDESTNTSILEMTKRIMPIFSYYSTITSFIEEKSDFEHGLVNHAVCAAMRDMLKDYFILIAQLEHQHLSNNLSLQKMMFYLQPTMLKLQSIASTAEALNKGDCFGGTVLSVLHKRASSLIGDKVGQELCFHLVQCASVPYFEILEKWIYKGIISDPYSEFLVEDNELVKKEDVPVEYCNHYWEKRYTIRRENIPVFLETVADMILRTGKYLNVVRQCGHNIKCPNATPLTYVIGEQPYFQRIHTAYQFASKKLLDLLMEDNDLEGRLRSVKHYFLLDKGDFIVQFMDMAEEELYKDIDDIMPSRLESLLELALRTSAVNSDKYKDDVKVILLMESLQSQMLTILNVPSTDQKDGSTIPDVPITGMEAFAFDYEVKWPLSLIINQRAIACYQLVFRHLFHCKHVEALLGRVWTLNKVAKTYPLIVSSSYSSAFVLCHRMLNFIQTLDYYFTLEIIEPQWQSFKKKIPKVSNVDEVLQLHEDFLNTCIQDCMLAFPELLQILGKLIKLCGSFSSFMQGTHRNAVEAEFSSMGNSLLAPLYEDSPLDGKGDAKSMSFQMSFQQQISQFTTDFDRLFVNFLKMITDLSTKMNSAKMLNMLYRLDFNGFYLKEKNG